MFITMKLVQHKNNCFLFVSKVLDDLRLDLHHVAGGHIGDFYNFLFNTKTNMAGLLSGSHHIMELLMVGLQEILRIGKRNRVAGFGNKAKSRIPDLFAAWKVTLVDIEILFFGGLCSVALCDVFGVSLCGVFGVNGMRDALREFSMSVYVELRPTNLEIRELEAGNLERVYSERTEGGTQRIEGGRQNGLRVATDQSEGGRRTVLETNTKFFHSKATQRRKKNHISGIQNAHGQWVEELEEVVEVASDYFDNLFRPGVADQMEECLNAVPNKVIDNMQEVLLGEFTAEEVKEALFQMGPTKAPGPDGMNALFYQKFWHIVGDDVVSAILDFLNNGNMLPEINHTNIVLIPKVKNPQKMSEFRPISLCNVIYKIISKVLVDRLKQVLPDIISPTQSAFVPGRLITDNVLVAYETIHTMHVRKKGKKGTMTLKLDVSKAYDRVEWPFLQKIMEKLGFPARWIERVMSCVTTPSFSILVNGKPHGMIQPSTRIRQGDPLSPYLFLLCAEGFTALLAKAKLEGRITGVSICRGAPRVTNLLFADDSLLFCQATPKEGEVVAEILQIYEQASGQSINLEKSSAFFSKNTTDTQKQQMLQILGVKEVVKFESYLGLPTLIGRDKYHTFAYLKDRVWKKLQGWKGMLLSKAGKEILIKAVAQSIPTYTMSVFLLPLKLCDELNNLCAKFWWRQVSNERKIHWKNWDKLSTSKKEGGMGFQDLKAFNLVMLAKQGWRMIQGNDSLLHKCFKARYFPRSSFLDAKESPGCSHVWRSLVTALPILKAGYCWTVGNESSIQVLGDRWISNHPTNKVLHPNYDLLGEMVVSDLINPKIHVWRSELIYSSFDQDDAEAICRIQLSRRHVVDSIIWSYNKNGNFSVKSAYKVARRIQGEDRAESSVSSARTKIWHVLWNLKIPNKIKVFGWRACTDILPTRANLVRRKVLTDDKCPICLRESENTIHAIWECVAVQDIWAGSCGKLQKRCSGVADVMQLMECLCDRLTREELELFWVQAWLAWNQRNRVVFGGNLMDLRSLNNRAEVYLTYYRQAQEQLTVTRTEHQCSKTWQPPPSSTYKLNFDAAIFADMDRTRVGVIIRNEQGQVMAAMTATGPKVSSSEEAELLACRRSMEFAVDAGFTKLIIEGDNVNVMQAISSPRINCSLLGYVVDDIRHLVHCLEWARISITRRGGNKVAHALAQHARNSLDNNVYWMEDSPPPAMEALIQDVLLL
ncbi:hypothetical protein SO802_006277 [Lithocarpus litseifolius]|uniref:Reverse transcriptase domain-containing protein n=1 Tax=Lithocarpus litseifolius TaxID=425828 RepID=A0AAW2DNU1_9ROSI